MILSTQYPEETRLLEDYNRVHLISECTSGSMESAMLLFNHSVNDVCWNWVRLTQPGALVTLEEGNFEHLL